MMTTPTPTLDGFRAWLQAKPADAFVGVATYCSRCPIAAYLQALGVFGAEVDLRHWWARPDTDMRFALPAWAVAFEDALDACGRLEITAGRALEVLASVTGTQDTTLPG